VAPLTKAEDSVNPVSGSPFGVALSLHPISSIATGEVLGTLLESVGYAPSLVVLFVSANHRPHLQEIVHATQTILGPQCLVGSLSKSVFADGYLSHEEPAIVAWAGRTGNAVGFGPTRPRTRPDEDHNIGSATLALGTSPGECGDLLQQLSIWPTTLLGGVPAGGHRQPVQIFLDGEIYDEGLVGVDILAGTVRPLVSSGAQPIGNPLTVTKAEGSVAFELAFQSARSRMDEVVSALPDDERPRLRGGMHLGIDVEGRATISQRHDSKTLLREVLGSDRSNGALALSGDVRIGDRVQFHVRDRLSVAAELRTALTEVLAGGGVQAALAFASQSRGRHFFGDGESDASMISDYLRAPLAGVFCSHELGPVSGAPYVHTRYLTAALFQS
jgi:small ligand-binding sensory domain FIST